MIQFYTNSGLFESDVQEETGHLHLENRARAQESFPTNNVFFEEPPGGDAAAPPVVRHHLLLSGNCPASGGSGHQLENNLTIFIFAESIKCKSQLFFFWKLFIGQKYFLLSNFGLPRLYLILLFVRFCS